MKKTTLVAAILCMASIALAQSTVTLGVFGYSKISYTNTYHISGMQFDKSPSNTPAIVYGDALPKGSKIYRWTGTGYEIATYDDVFVPFTGLVTKWNKDFELGSANGYWVESSASTDAVLSGDVPMEDSITNSIAIGFQLLSYPYPVDRLVTNMGLNPSKGDKVYAWNGSGYEIATYDDVFVPFTGLVTKWNKIVAIKAGHGFWYSSEVNTDWITQKPY